MFGRQIWYRNKKHFDITGIVISEHCMWTLKHLSFSVNSDEELTVFPVDSNFLPSLKERLSLALKIDKLEHG
jgi:hypothetical protein